MTNVETEEFPYKSVYDHLITGRTIHKRGNWWTAALLVQSVANASRRKVIIQRWKKTNRPDPDQPDGLVHWGYQRNFTLNSAKQWNIIKEIIDEWLASGDWE